MGPRDSRVQQQLCPSGSSKCATYTSVIQNGDDISVTKGKFCDASCHSGSVNTGKIRSLSECCDTDLCNVQDAPDPRSIAPNGKKCYTCDGQSCTNIMSCSGTEDHCTTITGTSKDELRVIKGCASKSVCDATIGVSGVEVITCCKGNLCNGAQSVTQSSTYNGAQSVSQSFLFLCCSLLSYFLLH